MHNDIKGNKHNNTKDNTKQTQHNKMEIARPQTRTKGTPLNKNTHNAKRKENTTEQPQTNQ